MRIWPRLVLAAVMGVVGPAAVAATCSSPPSGTINLGTYTGVQSPAGVGAVTVTCPAGLAYGIGLDAGGGSGATTTTRKLTGSGGATVSYGLFQNVGRTTQWGNSNGIDTAAGLGTNGAQAVTAYPQFVAGQRLPAPGIYTDTVIATVYGTSPLASAPINLIAMVDAACTISAMPLSFGNYTGVVSTAAATVTVMCSDTTSYNVGLSAGLATGATVTTRQMTGPTGATLGYVLTSDALHAVNWGFTIGTDTVAGTGTGATRDITVYGQIAAGHYVAPGAYTDTITVTLTY